MPLSGLSTFDTAAVEKLGNLFDCTAALPNIADSTADAVAWIVHGVVTDGS